MTEHVLIYAGHRINERDEMLSLTDMWRAAGRPENLKPNDWVSQERTAKRIDHLYKTSIATTDGNSVIQTFRGAEGGTWAHWALAIEYAEDLSTEMWFWAKTAIREKMERLHAPIQATAVLVADTVGAGDAYTAALALGLLAGDAPQQILEHAHRVAEFVCTQPGATPALPAELRQLFGIVA